MFLSIFFIGRNFSDEMSRIDCLIIFYLLAYFVVYFMGYSYLGRLLVYIMWGYKNILYRFLVFEKKRGNILIIEIILMIYF